MRSIGVGVTVLAFAAVTGCLGDGTSTGTSPVPETPSPTPGSPQDVVNEVVLPRAEFPASYQARRKVARDLEAGTNSLCGYDATDEKRVARVQVYYWTRKRETASNEAVAYPDAATAKKALAYHRRLVKYCDEAAQERNGIDGLRRVSCPDGVLADAVCLRFEVVDDTGRTSQTYKVVQARGEVMTAVYANAPESLTAIPVAEALARKSALRTRRAVEG